MSTRVLDTMRYTRLGHCLPGVGLHDRAGERQCFRADCKFSRDFKAVSRRYERRAGGKSREEAAAEDEQAQFKHSWLVSWWRSKLGLSLDHAYWLCVLLNFAVIARRDCLFRKKNLPGMFRDRTASIQRAMQEARQASEEANRRLAEIEARLSRLDAEIGGMREAAEKEAAAEEVRIKAAAAGDARKIVESAEQEIAAAAKSARRELTYAGESGGITGGQAD